MRSSTQKIMDIMGSESPNESNVSLALGDLIFKKVVHLGKMTLPTGHPEKINYDADVATEAFSALTSSPNMLLAIDLAYAQKDLVNSGNTNEIETLDTCYPELSEVQVEWVFSFSSIYDSIDSLLVSLHSLLSDDDKMSSSFDDLYTLASIKGFIQGYSMTDQDLNRAGVSRRIDDIEPSVADTTEADVLYRNVTVTNGLDQEIANSSFQEEVRGICSP